MSNKVHIEYYALLRVQRGIDSETVDTDLDNYGALYDSLREMHGFTASRDQLRIARNESFASFDDPVTDGDKVVFITPVAGG